MSTSPAKDLVKKIASDKAFRQQLEGAGTKEARRAILTKNGFGAVTAADVRVVAKSQAAALGSELTDEQLAAVAGGRWVEWAGVVVSAAALAL